MRADNEPGELAVRVNTLLADPRQLARELPVPTHADPLIPEALVLEEPLDMHASPLWRAGAFHAQSRGAMLVARALGPRPGERVLDLCAAPGGKSTHLAALMRGAGEVVAVERNPRRAAELRDTARRLHAASVRVEVADAAREREHADFDRVLADPPCSGLGTLQARPDLRWRLDPASLPQMVAEQRLILHAGAHALRPGGVLVYSTCTISADENERLIEAFLDSHRDFALDELAAELPGLALGTRTPTAAGRPSGGGAAWGQLASRLVQTLPQRDRTAGRKEDPGGGHRGQEPGEDQGENRRAEHPAAEQGKRHVQ